MKKLLKGLLLTVLVLALAACGTKGNSTGNTSGADGNKENEKLVVGASNTPHAIILEKAIP
jgi:D-methionine transport system substrate-binding protein